MEENVKGKFVTITKGNGIKYKLYVPENVNADTPIFTYAYGSGDPDMEKCVSELGSDSIIIGTIVNYSSDIGSITMDIVNEVKEEYGVTSTIVSPSGFSLGGPVGLEVAAENIRQNPDCKPQTVFLIDGYGTYFYNPSLHINDTEKMNLFKENETVFFAFDLDQKTTDINKLYAEAGLNVIMVKCNGQSHGGINSSFFSNGLYNYRSDEELPKDGYVYSIYNTETGLWEEIPYEKVQTLSDVYELFGIEYNGEHKYTIQEMANLEDLEISSSDKALATLLNGIRGAIRNSNIVRNGYVAGGCSSSTLMPSQVPAVVSRYFEATTNSLSKLVNETDQFAKIGESIDDMEFYLEREARELNAIDITIATYGSDSVKSNTTVENVDNTSNQITDNSWNSTSNEVTNYTAGSTSNLIFSSTLGNTSTNIGSSTKVEDNPVYEFVPYDKVISDDNRIVFESDDGYKAILHIEDDSIIGIEHYYDLNSNEEITLDSINELYRNNEYVNEIIQEGNYVKVIFDVDMYKEYNLKEVKTLYANDKQYTYVGESE